MEIQTKLSIGETGFILDEGIIKEVRVKEIKTHAYEDGQFNNKNITIIYMAQGFDSIHEENIFIKKEELFESIPVKEL